MRKIAGCACAGNAGSVFPRRRLQRKPRVSDPGMNHGTCVRHVPWCMSGSLTRGGGENVPVIPGACAPAILRIWQEAHGITGVCHLMSHTDWNSKIFLCRHQVVSYHTMTFTIYSSDIHIHTKFYRIISNIRRIKSQNINVSRLRLQLPLSNILKPSVKWRTEM